MCRNGALQADNSMSMCLSRAFVKTRQTMAPLLQTGTKLRPIMGQPHALAIKSSDASGRGGGGLIRALAKCLWLPLLSAWLGRKANPIASVLSSLSLPPFSHNTNHIHILGWKRDTGHSSGQLVFSLARVLARDSRVRVDGLPTRCVPAFCVPRIQASASLMESDHFQMICGACVPGLQSFRFSPRPSATIQVKISTAVGRMSRPILAFFSLPSRPDRIIRKLSLNLSSTDAKF
ncbi:hypothetical protein B0J12DRAFT_298907 [Macrophomina phaseolina]|uniref:Uncharacterized protein n=1 Tax=Macrophomina phaseolina TaxID=35725 RepID=A0ABQ8GPV7_9PEZI|nr:hypothetical protein B0J12DRAFT_298907 [Macrophomina phaseolina]